MAVGPRPPLSVVPDVPAATAAPSTPAHEILKHVPLDFLQKHLLLPLEGGDNLRIGIASRESLPALEDIRLLLHRDIEPVMMARDEVEEGLRGLLVEKLETAGEDEEASLLLGEEESLDLYTVSTQAPIVQLVNSMFLKAVGAKASDIHLEPYEDQAIVRIRVDGVLQDAFTIPRPRYASVVARLKVLARLNLAENRLPQDGRIKVRAGGDRRIDIRVSIVPTSFGERVVLRLLDQGLRMLTLAEVGLEDEVHRNVKSLGTFTNGLVLSTGPTGSGKSTTLYAMLLEIQSPHRNIITIEDPVEYQVARIGQIQVNPAIGLTFAKGLRSILRQDPDIIMVGEIRDPETADIAIHAALTGHLVLSTLHTNDAPTAVSRLLDMGIQGYLISASLRGVIAQRLVRRLCRHCRQPYRPEAGELEGIGLNAHAVAGHTLYRPNGRGCPECFAGYRGRIALFEVLKVDEDIAHLIALGKEATTIRAAAREKGLRTLLEDGHRKLLAGVTSVEEVLLATRV